MLQSRFVTMPVFRSAILSGLMFVAIEVASQQQPSSAPPPVSPAGVQNSTPAATAAHKPAIILPAESVYKNVQIFKGKEATRLLPAMIALRGLLGVECSHCHVPTEWDKDDKPQKPTA